MVDWKGLFEFSQKYNDGTKKTQFTPMTEEERKWLEEAINQYTYDEADVMKKIIPVLADHKEKDKVELIENLEELQEIIENHERNSTNLERLGGFKALMDVMFNNEHDQVRRIAMLIFSFCVQNNAEMQETAHKHGGLELLHQYIKEESEKNKDQVIGAFSSLIRTTNVALKAEFFSDLKGLDWLKQIILSKNTSKKSLRKIYFLLYDLIVKETDKGVETVLYKDNLVKDYIVKNKKIVSAMLESLEYTDESLHSEHVLREFVLNCLGAIFQYSEKSLTKKIEAFLTKTVGEIEDIIKSITDNGGDKDTADCLSHEITMISDIVNRSGDFLLLKQPKHL